MEVAREWGRMTKVARKRVKATTGTEAKDAPKAVEKFTNVVSEALENNGQEIANCLVKNAKKGHAASAKLLVELAANKKPAKKKSSRTAEMIAKEPEWPAGAAEKTESSE